MTGSRNHSAGQDASMAAARERGKRWTAGLAGSLVVAMVALSFAAVPLYDLFCRVTGYGGTTQTAETAPLTVGERVLTIRFNADLAGGMAWQFKPVQSQVSVRVGEQKLAFYRAHNPTDRTIVGQASFNVTPQKAGLYFSKVDCFCFTEQSLAPGESVDMPVAFFVDPEIVNDPNLDEVKSITLSYTFFDIGPEQAAANAVERKPGLRFAQARSVQ